MAGLMGYRILAGDPTARTIVGRSAGQRAARSPDRPGGLFPRYVRLAAEPLLPADRNPQRHRPGMAWSQLPQSQNRGAFAGKARRWSGRLFWAAASLIVITTGATFMAP